MNRSSHSSTVHRKFFHLTVSLVCVTGIVYDFELIWLSAWLMLCIFAIIEVCLWILMQHFFSFLVFIDIEVWLNLSDYFIYDDGSIVV